MIRIGGYQVAQTTKRALAVSLKMLMENHLLDNITVKDVVNACGVNRQTFYYHFHDIYDLLSWIYKTEALESISDFRTYDTWQQGFYMMFTYVSQNKNFCINTFRSLGREHLDQFLYEITFDLLMNVVNELSLTSSIGEREKTLIANFYSFGFIGLLTSWMSKGMEEDPKQIVEDLNTLIEGDIIKVVKKYQM